MDVNLALLALTVMFAYMLNATTGFGGAIITVTLAVHLYPVDFLVPVIVLLNIYICVYIVARHHAGIDTGLLFRKILPYAGAGLPIGLVIFNVIQTDILETVLGAFVVCFSVLELVIIIRSDPRAERKALGPVKSAVWLLLGGIVQGMYASGGSMVVYYAGRNIPDKRVFRSTLSALWLILNSVMMVTNLFTGRMTATTVWYSVVLLPVLVIGIAAGEWLHLKTPERAFRILIFIMLTVAGVSILL